MLRYGTFSGETTTKEAVLGAGVTATGGVVF